VRRCILCGATEIDVAEDGRLVIVTCVTCAAVVQIEFDPPDRPDLRGRIEVLEQADDPIPAD
jgi:hypothetical protein